ncbi:MAG: sulfotransferase domain-containing protein [Xanthomonadales bacterium]|nr:sulfotransferase domain-containing protein [Xanthomonadales bacterium]
MHVKKHLRPDGVLPDFLIIGAMKCGTTTLFKMLEQHPGFLPPVTKEIHYFDSPLNNARGQAWYRAHYPSERDMQAAEKRLGHAPLTGEATPAMSAPMYARNAAELVPDARIIVSLRNPVDRAWSHYQHYQRHPKPDPLDFQSALERELSWLAEGNTITEDNFLRLSPTAHRLGYVLRGRYVEQLEKWFEYFPKNQFLILNFERWVQDPASAARRVAEHVGLPAAKLNATRSNQGGYQKSMPQACRDLLTEYYRPWNRRLFDMIEEEWDWPC